MPLKEPVRSAIVSISLAENLACRGGFWPFSRGRELGIKRSLFNEIILKYTLVSTLEFKT
jgi:hypothetical protein